MVSTIEELEEKLYKLKRAQSFRLSSFTRTLYENEKF
jgi:hypothetical protein